MAFFTQDYLTFFQELAKNNQKEWFHANKNRYEKAVKEPFITFIQETINEIHKDTPDLTITPKETLFRINRDIRFSKDKSPYKMHMAAFISKNGRKDKSQPGLYLEFGAEKAAIYSGAHLLNKEQLYNIRSAISAHLKKFNDLLSEKKFKEKFGTLHGEEQKRIPKEFQAAAKKQPHLLKKSFYYFAHLPPEVVLADNLLEQILEYYDAGKNMGNFLRDAMLTKA